MHQGEPKYEKRGMGVVKNNLINFQMSTNCHFDRLNQI
jgi:hypothetical protein